MKKERCGLIYIATNQVNGKSYIGKTVEYPRRKKDHLRATGKTHFDAAIRKYGCDAFEWGILESEIPESELLRRESFWIAHHGTIESGYNHILIGTDGSGGTLSDATKAKISEAKLQLSAEGKNPMHDPEVVARQAASQSKAMRRLGAEGKHPKQRSEARKQMSERLLELSEKGELHQQTPEGKAKIREGMLRLSKARKNPMHDPENVAKNMARGKETRIRKKRKAQKELGYQFLWEEEQDYADD